MHGAEHSFPQPPAPRAEMTGRRRRHRTPVKRRRGNPEPERGKRMDGCSSVDAGAGDSDGWKERKEKNTPVNRGKTGGATWEQEWGDLQEL